VSRSSARPGASTTGAVATDRGFRRNVRFARHIDRIPPALAGLLIQVVATAVAIALNCVAEIVSLDAPWTFWALVQAGVAVLLATASGQAPWWIVMHSVFAPAALLLDRVGPPPWVYLGCAGLIALTNPNALRDRVPLFLSSRAARDRLLELLPVDRAVRFIDVGCGFGGVVAAVGRERPTLECLGLETAWIPYLVSRVRCATVPNPVTVCRRDLWQHDLSSADVVYAYLSPVPMARLWRKVVAEMRPGSLLVSNTFAVPDVEPMAELPVYDSTGSVLYVYRIPEAAESVADVPSAAPRAVRAAAASTADATATASDSRSCAGSAIQASRPIAAASACRYAASDANRSISAASAR
jgi:hypothetical protein